MDEYQHMERFSMENDFSGAQWIGGEFYYSKKRRETRTQTREEALYGVFEESDSDDESSSKRRRRGDVIKKGDLSKPVSFVSTGTFKPSEDIPKPEEEASSADQFSHAGLGSAGLGAGSGLGFAASTAEAADDEEEDTLFPTAFGKRVKEAAERREKEREMEKARLTNSSKGKGGSASIGADMAEFERHTKGIGMRLLEKMGYKGGGLGKNAQGIAVPIEAKLRPKNMGMGFNDYKEVHASSAALPASIDEKENKNKEIKPKEQLWKKKFKGKRKDFKTADDLLVSKSEQGVESVQTILDMRGPQPRVLTNLEHLNAEQADIEDDVPMPELQHNVRLIVDLVEADIQTFDKKLKQEKDTAVLLEKERVRLQGEVDRQKGQINTLELITKTLADVQQKVASGLMRLDAVAAAFSSLQREYAEEYKMHNLSALALSFGLPLMVKVFHGWEPLLQPLHGTDILGLWKRLLQGDDPVDYSVFPDANSYSDSPYAQLIMEAVFPILRFAAVNIWEPRDPEPMLRFLEIWESLLPKSVLHSILEHIVMPKLSLAVDQWDPRQETVPIHAWLHPWLPLLGQRMEPLYHPIRYKLESALRAWHASDSSAYALLSPWQTVFDPGSWEMLLVKSILPKLMAALQELVINPQAQQLEPFRWVMTWGSAVPIHHMVPLLEAGFFVKWRQVLYNWLCSAPDFEEVTQWYLGWKSLLTPELLANDRVRWHLQSALDMMDQAVEGMPVVQPGARENVSYLRVTEKRQFETQQQAAAAAAAAAYSQQQSVYAGATRENVSTSAEMTLKEVVETFAEQNDVQFLPKIGRLHDGFQVYGFGSTNVCMDNAQQRLYAQTGDRWVAVALEQLLEMSRAVPNRWK
ncbi:hypothetical protein L7F22_068982 [Adiantum nelumboides]|nr:hypothetical protein [Adiantum nelumboides]